MKQKGWLQICIMVAIGVAIAWFAGDWVGEGDSSSSSSSALGLSSDTRALQEVVVPDGLPQQMLRYKGMDVNFNPTTHQPNYVVWELLPSETDGEASRLTRFSPDPRVSASAVTADYSNSGYDRGHMAPAGDMKWADDAMAETFYLTNICPQHPDLNRGAWKKLEEKCRVKAVDDSALIIVCGPVFNPSTRRRKTIGETRVAVPDAFFKVILAPFAKDPSAIGFIMPNGYVKGGMQQCAVPVDSVEALTGYDFFSALPDDIEDPLESTANFPRWSQRPPR